MKTSTSIDEYIAGHPKAIQVMLEKTRETIRKAAPTAEETINYGIPTFKLNGNLVHFAAFKSHLGFYPAPSGIEKFKKELSVYKGAKGSVQFPFEKPIPYALITKIVKFRVSENTKTALPKKATPAKKKITPAKKTAPSKKKSDKEEVELHISELSVPVQQVVQAIRKIILSTDKLIGERIKWNNPSFYYTGEMRTSDPKAYKRELAVFNLFKNRIMLVFPSGAKVDDSSGLLKGDYKDGRRIVIFNDLEEVKKTEKNLRQVIQKWLTLVDA